MIFIKLKAVKEPNLFWLLYRAQSIYITKQDCMANELINIVSSLWVIFSFSFLVALPGTMAPSPLFTYTIIKSVQSGRRGYLIGLWIIMGHAVLEMVIIIFLLFGFSFILQNIIVLRTIGVADGALLIYFGLSIILNVYKDNLLIFFLNPVNRPDHDELGKTKN